MVTLMHTGWPRLHKLQGLFMLDVEHFDNDILN